MIRTPLKLIMLLHYHSIAEPYSVHNQDHAKSIAVAEQRQELIEEDMIEHAPIVDNFGSGFKTTEKGKAYIEYILKLPYPVNVWIMKD